MNITLRLIPHIIGCATITATALYILYIFTQILYHGNYRFFAQEPNLTILLVEFGLFVYAVVYVVCVVVDVFRREKRRWLSLGE